MTYNFQTQHKKGKEAEYFIYALFQDRFNVIPAPSYMQAEGIDFTFSDRVNGQVHTVELKTDTRAALTGNAFIETVSNSREAIHGWAYTSQADWLLYFLPQKRLIYRIDLKELRMEMAGWERLYPVRSIPNQGRGGDYNTVGLLVPLSELTRIAEELIEF
jgi:hypothetical protein